MSEYCNICDNLIFVYSIGKCNHSSICFLCSLRLRKPINNPEDDNKSINKNSCPFCKTDLDKLYLSSLKKRFEDLQTQTPYKQEKNDYNVIYMDQNSYVRSLKYLGFYCGYPKCSFIGMGWKELKQHALKNHGLVYCEVCIKNKNCFPVEQLQYKKENLKEHLSYIKGKELGFRGHPLCKFCNIRLYDTDDLFKHMKIKHEQCELCFSVETSNEPIVFRNYNDLEKHYEEKHFVCRDRTCRSMKVGVFKNEIEYKIHLAKEHNINTNNTNTTKRGININFILGTNNTNTRGYFTNNQNDFPRLMGNLNINSNNQNSNHNNNEYYPSLEESQRRKKLLEDKQKKEKDSKLKNLQTKIKEYSKNGENDLKKFFDLLDRLTKGKTTSMQFITHLQLLFQKNNDSINEIKDIVNTVIDYIDKTITKNALITTWTQFEKSFNQFPSLSTNTQPTPLSSTKNKKAGFSLKKEIEPVNKLQNPLDYKNVVNKKFITQTKSNNNNTQKKNNKRGTKLKLSDL